MTPGPWQWETLPSGRWVLSGGPLPTPVILTVDWKEFGPLADAESDRRLIAAAPELLEALENLARVCEGVCHGWPGGDPFRDIENARALVAKAKGRSDS